MNSWFTILRCAAILSPALCTPMSTIASFNLFNSSSSFVFELNVFALNVSIDRCFKIREKSYANKKLNETLYKMIALLFMRNLVLRDWKSLLSDAKSPTSPQYLEVIILEDSKSMILEEQVPVHFLIWSLNLIMYLFISRNRFLETTFDLFWNNQKQDRLEFRHMYSQALKSF